MTRDMGNARKGEQNHAEESEQKRILKDRAARWASQSVRLVPSDDAPGARRRKKEGQDTP